MVSDCHYMRLDDLQRHVLENVGRILRLGAVHGGLEIVNRAQAFHMRLNTVDPFKRGRNFFDGLSVSQD